MGISIQQYRSAIGRWNAGKIKQTFQTSAPPHVMGNNTERLPSPHLVKGPWKLHALILSVAVITLTMMTETHDPTTTISTALPSDLHTPLRTNTSSVTQGLMPQSGLISHQCLQSLLAIAGVELNPGPSQDPVKTLEEQQNIIAELCANAPSNEVRNTLRLYDPQLNTQGLEKQLNKTSKNLLVSSLEYLGVPGMSNYRKETCVSSLICKLQNLFPDQCGFCKKDYCVKLTETPLLTCGKCGQGSHDPCIMDLLDIPEADRPATTPQMVWNLVNPKNLTGLHYLCQECETNIIPTEDDGKIKQRLKSTKESEDAPDQNAAPDGEHNSVEETVFPSQPQPSLDVPPLSVELPRREDGDDSERRELPDQQPKPDRVQDQQGSHAPPNQQLGPVRTSDQQGSQATPDQHQNRPICRFYQQGTCRFGMAGRGCPHDHPPPCSKLIKHGNRGPSGCTLGRSCDKFHPKMCPSSLSKRECFKSDCKLRHIPGTKRKKTEADPELPTTVANNTNTQNLDPNHFLDMMQAMEARILNVLEQRFTSLTTTQHMAQEQAPAPSQAPDTAPVRMPPAPQQQNPTCPCWPALNPTWPAQIPSWPAQNPTLPAQNTSQPAQNPPGLAYMVWPQRQINDTQAQAQGIPGGTSQQMVWMPMPLSS